jgi:DNA end-binding protein Ku
MPRAIWTGTLQFVLISFPVKLYKATDDKGVSFKNLHVVCGHNINLKKWCNVCDLEVPSSEIVKGYQIGKEQYVIFTEEEIDNVLPENAKTITIEAAVLAEDIPVITYNTSYFMTPDKGGEHVYNLLFNVLSTRQKVLIGRIVMRSKEHLVSIRPYEDGLLLSMLHFSEDVRDIHEVVYIKNKQVDPKEIDLATNLIEQLTGSFSKIDQVDKYKQHIEKMAEMKATGQVITIAPTKHVKEVKNILDGLQKSIEVIAGVKVAGTAGEKIEKDIHTPTSTIEKSSKIDNVPLLKMPAKEGIKEQLDKIYGITEEEINKILLEQQIEDGQDTINTLKELRKYNSFKDYVKDHNKEFEYIEIGEDFKTITILDKNYPRINIPILKKIGMVAKHFDILIYIKSSHKQIIKKEKLSNEKILEVEDGLFEF